MQKKKPSQNRLRAAKEDALTPTEASYLLAACHSLPIVPELESYLQELSKKGINRTRQALWQRFDRIRERSELRKVAYPHCLRASYAIDLANSGFTVYGLAYLMGWDSLEPAEHYAQNSMKAAHKDHTW